MIDIKVNKDNSEIIPYDEAGIPIYIREGYLSFYPNYRALCHWHEDIELIYVLDGRMKYYVNGKVIILKSGDSVMINSGSTANGFLHISQLFRGNFIRGYCCGWKGL